MAIRTTALTAVLLGVITSSFLISHGSAAAQAGTCRKSEGQAGYTCVVVVSRDSPNRREEIGGDLGPPLVWKRTQMYDNPGADPMCVRQTTTALGTTTEFGVPWLVTVRNSQTGTFLLIRGVCEWSGGDPPQPPPPAPGRTDIEIDQDAVFALSTGINPPVELRGVSQLPTWFWCSNAGPVDVVAEIWPYRAAAAARVARVVWTIDGPDGHVEIEATDCGDEPSIHSDGADAAAVWTPNEAGESTITLTTEWSAQWTYTYFDPVLGAVNLGTFDLGLTMMQSEPFTYSVYEIQTVGVSG